MQTRSSSCLRTATCRPWLLGVAILLQSVRGADAHPAASFALEGDAAGGSSVVLSRDLKHLATRAADGRVRIWETGSGQVSASWFTPGPDPDARGESSGFAPQQPGGIRKVKVWDLD